MSFKISDHFSLLKKEKIKENKTTVLFFEHKKTKAQVLYFDNDNESAGFGTFFKTPAENSKGTTHILEHSVFEGSKKYDQGNSLDYILNNSLSSVFNAVTYPDKTMYYFCSSFQKDYLNLLDIYLDFVYFPKLEEKTLRKEGHFFKKNPENYEFNGIVFNEMKNSLLGFYSKVYDSVSHFFLPGSSYSHIYGGDPLEVVELKIEELRSYHKEKYHPSNSHTILYGKINKNKVFSKLNEVFSQFEFEEKSFEINAIPVGENKKMSLEYQDLDGGENNFIKYYLLKGINEEEDYLGIELAKNYYLSYDFSPLRREIEDSKLCSSVEEIVMTEFKFPIFAILCRGVEHNQIEKLEDLIDKCIYKYSKNISKEVKDLLLRRYEFKLKEIEFYQNQGQDVIFSAARFLNYNQDPLIGLRNYKSLKIIQKLLKGKNFEKFLREKFLPSQTLSIKFTPNKNLLENYNVQLQKKLQEKLNLYDLYQLDKEIIEHEKFLNQEKIEPKYPSIKKIKVQDLDLKVPKFDHEVKNEIFYSYLNSSDLNRVSLNFDVSDFNFSKLEYLGIYLNIVNQIASKNHDLQSFSFLKKKHFSDFNINLSNYFNTDSNKKISLITLFMKFLDSDKEKVLEILKEFILNSNFRDKDRIRFLLEEQFHSLKESISEDPLHHAIQKSLSFMNEIEYIKYDIGSLPMINKLKFILKNFDNEFESLADEMQLIHNYIFNQNCLINLGVSRDNLESSSFIIDSLAKELNILPGSFKKLGSVNLPSFTFPKKNLNFFLPSNSDTNFNVMAVKYKEIEKSDKSVINILEPYLNQYLWDNIRIKNGAYGAHFFVDKNYDYSCFFSYSDPRINETFLTYSNTRNNFNLSKFKKYSFEKMKLRFLSGFKQVYRNSDIFNLSFSDYLKGNDYKKKQQSLESKIALNYIQFKKLFNNLKNPKFSIKVIASTTERIKIFSEPYEKLS